MPAAILSFRLRHARLGLVALGHCPSHGPLGRLGSKDRDKVDDAFTLADVETFTNRLVDTLSGGERRRVWLAMLVAQDARWLLLDEPTSAWNVAHQVEVLTLVRKLARERGLGVVVVLHDMNMAAQFCDDILALKEGRLIACVTPESIMTPERLQSILRDCRGRDQPSDLGVPMGFVRQHVKVASRWRWESGRASTPGGF